MRMESFVVRAVLFSTLVSGLQCFVVKKNEMGKLNSCLNHLLRLALAGKATKKILVRNQLGLETTVYVSISNVDLHKLMEIVDVATEMQITRLKFFQRIVSEPIAGRQWLTLFFS